MASKARPMAILLLGGLVSCYAGSDRQPGGVAIVEPPPGGAAKPMMPFAFERQAEVVAFGHMGEPFEANGRSLVRLHIDKVLKGAVTGSGIDALDALPDFGCVRPENPRIASSLYAPGTPVVCHLDDYGSHWTLLSLRRLEPLVADALEHRIVRFTAVHAAGSARNASSLYADLLEPRAGGLDEPAYWAIMHNPNRAAIPPLMKLLDRTVAATERGPGVAETAISRLVHVLSMLNESRAIEQLAVAFPRIQRGTRIKLYPYLDRLAGDDKTLKAHVRSLLYGDLNDPNLVAHSFHFQTVTGMLGTLADHDVVIRLLAEQSRHAHDSLGQYLPRALTAAHERVNAADRGRIIDAWVGVLESFEAPAELTASETAVVREVVRSLQGVELDPSMRARLERVRGRDASGWYAGELSAVLQ